MKPAGAAPALGWAALLGVAALALAWPVLPFDAWWYHLPFAARLGGIPGADSFGFDPMIAARWQGFPKAWHWLMGWAWAITGTKRAVLLPLVLLLAGFATFLWRRLGVAPPWLALGLFASPMLLVHAQAAYLDLPVGLCLALALLALVLATEAARGPAGTIPALPALLAVGALGLAGNIKLQGTIGTALVAGIAAALAVAVPAIPPRRRAALLGLIAAGTLLAGLTLAGNAIRFGNPVYPLAVAGFGLSLPGPEDAGFEQEPPAYLLSDSRIIQLPGPVNYLLSLTELDWTLRGVAPWYNVDAFSGRLPRRGSPSRTGGLGAVFVLAHLALLGWQAARWRRLADGLQRRLVLASAALLLLAAFLPRAHELRYWLVVPLVLVAVNLRYLAQLGWPPAARAALVVLMLHGTALALLSPRSDLVVRPPVSQEDLRAAVPLAIQAALERYGSYCNPADRELFRFSPVATGLPGQVSRNPADCNPP